MIKLNGQVIAHHETEYRVLDADCFEGFPAETRDEAEFIARGLGGRIEKRDVYCTEWRAAA